MQVQRAKAFTHNLKGNETSQIRVSSKPKMFDLMPRCSSQKFPEQFDFGLRVNPA